MLRLLSIIVRAGRATGKDFCPPLPDGARGLPDIVSESECVNDCRLCADQCPTAAITLTGEGQPAVALDRGACIGCGICIDSCPSGVFAGDLTTRTARRRRSDLIVSSTEHAGDGKETAETTPQKSIFQRSMAIRVVSTGCSACDLEVSAAFNPVFDLERFGVQLVASPRMADALVVTGPVGLGMQEALLRTYEAMPEPRLVVAAGTCAISGGVHRGGYSRAGGVDALLPVDVYIPGCPPHPWSIIHGILTAMDHHLVRDARE